MNFEFKEHHKECAKRVEGSFLDKTGIEVIEMVQGSGITYTCIGTLEILARPSDGTKVLVLFDRLDGLHQFEYSMREWGIDFGDNIQLSTTKKAAQSNLAIYDIIYCFDLQDKSSFVEGLVGNFAGSIFFWSSRIGYSRQLRHQYGLDKEPIFRYSLSHAIASAIQEHEKANK